MVQPLNIEQWLPSCPKAAHELDAVVRRLMILTTMLDGREQDEAAALCLAVHDIAESLRD